MKPHILTLFVAVQARAWVSNLLDLMIGQIKRNSYVYREGAELRLDGRPWTATGANMYWLGLDENVRPRPGAPFYAPFNDYYHGGKFNFLRFRGIKFSSSDPSKLDPLVQQFYTNRTIVQEFKVYIEHLITHVNLYTGLTYGQDPTIFAYETGNELGGPRFWDQDVPVEWTAEISLAPEKLVVDGTYGVNRTHLAIDTIDIFSDHYYPPYSTKLQDDIALVETANKVYLVGEYDWTGNNAQRDSLRSFYDVIDGRKNTFKPVVVGDLFWSLFMYDVPNCNVYVNHSDGFTLQYGNPANTAQNNTQIGLIRQHSKMQNGTVNNHLPCVP